MALATGFTTLFKSFFNLRNFLRDKLMAIVMCKIARATCEKKENTGFPTVKTNTALIKTKFCSKSQDNR